MIIKTTITGQLVLLLTIFNSVKPQILGPSLWQWYPNITKYSIYPDVPYTNEILFPHGDYEPPSACNGNPTDPWNVGFACPHLLMFSSDLLLAAERDGFGNHFFYGTAATKSDDDCGKCFQVQIGDAQVQWNDTFLNKQLVLQISFLDKIVSKS